MAERIVGVGAKKDGLDAKTMEQVKKMKATLEAEKAELQAEREALEAEKAEFAKMQNAAKK